MGRPKALLPFGPEVMLQRVVRIVGTVVRPVAVVAAPEQELPPLPDETLVVRDEREGLGPLAGLAVGLAALAGRARAAYASSCDVPLLSPEFVRAVCERLGGHELAIPHDGQYHHPLAAVYRTSLAELAAALVAAGTLRPVALIDAADAHVFDVAELRSADPQLASLRNANRPEDYRDALAAAGFGEDFEPRS
ncbi:MAG: NTP transferase domain-containing protein [Planctomycetes bacterium]|nr:NTP transferase domain-containing protein [Planctomycetota bacterium]